MDDSRAYWEDRLSARFGLDGVGYAGLGRPYNEWLYRVRERVFFDTVRRLEIDPRRLRVLDVGSGTGFYVRLWRRLGAPKVVGSDIAETSVRALSKAFPGASFVRMDAGQEVLPLDPGSFDVVSAFDVLFHIVDDACFARALLNLTRLLRPGGLLLYSDNFLHGPTLRAAHQVSRSLEDIQGCLRAAGLEPLRRRPMFVLMNSPVDSRSAIHKLGWRLFERVLRRFGSLGALAGAAVFPLEVLLLNLLREGPSTELLVCRRSPIVPPPGGASPFATSPSSVRDRL